ncbi:MAG: O-antigen ligase family protein, partial [Bulleidia sp.]
MSSTFLRKYHRILIWIIWTMPLSEVLGLLTGMDGSPCFYVSLVFSGIYLLLLVIHEKMRAVKEYLPELLVLSACALSTYLNRGNSSIDSAVRFFELLIYILALTAHPHLTTQKEARKEVRPVLFATYLYLAFLISASLILQVLYSLTGFETSRMTYLDHGILGGLFGNSNQLGISAYLALMLGYFFFSRNHRKINVINMLVMLAAIVLSQCRTVYIALVLTALFFVSHRISAENRKKLIPAMIMLVAAGAFLLIFATLRKSGDYTDGLKDYEILDRLTGNRYLIWTEALWVWQAYYPWFGVGLANLHQMVTTMPSRYDPTGPNPYAVYELRGYENAHNLIVNILGYTGIAGMICFLILFRRYQNSWNTKTVRKRYSVLRTLCICLIVMDMFDMVLLFDARMPAYLFCLLAGFFRVCAKEDEADKVYFVSNLVDVKDYWKLYTKKEKPGQQVQKFDRMIVSGLQKNGIQVRCYSAAPASRAVMKPFVAKLKNHGVFHYSICWTIPGFKD